MNKNLILVIILIAIVSLLSFTVLNLDKKARPLDNNSNNNRTAENKNCIPTFADGGGPYYLPNSPFREKIAPDNGNGEKLVVKGKVLQNDCKTIASNVALDIWQADETGEYQNEWYRGQVRTDSEGNYSFETVVPKGYGEGTGYRPPHIHFKVFQDNKEIITSQMFFPEVKGTPGFEDAFIMKVETKEENGTKIHNAIHNIILP